MLIEKGIDMNQHDAIEKMRDYMQEAFAECYEFTQVASLFHLIVQEAKIQVEFICNRISDERQENAE
jgi:hypothetical protein